MCFSDLRVIQSDLVTPQQAKYVRQMLDQPDILKDLASSFQVLLSTAGDWKWNAPLTPNIKVDNGGKTRIFFVPELFQTLFLTVCSLQIAKSFKYNYIARSQQFFRNRFDESVPEKFKSNPPHELTESLSFKRFAKHQADMLMMLDTGEENQNQRVFSGYGGAVTPQSRRHGNTVSSVTEEILIMIASDVRINSHFDPKKATYIVHIDFESFGASVPHEIVKIMLVKLRINPDIATLIANYLNAPVMMEDGIKTIKRGLINGVHLSRLIGEIMFSLLELYVVKQSSVRMFRIFDDIWMWGTSRKKMVQAVDAIKEFSSVCGLGFNENKTGFVCCPGALCTKKCPDFGIPNNPIGFGFLEIQSNGEIIISKEKVNIFAQLAKADLEEAAGHSVIEWAKRFNKNLTFFESSCGPFAGIFGGYILKDRTSALNRLFEVVLDGPKLSTSASSGDPSFQLVQYVERMIKSRTYGSHIFGSISVPWLFMPITAGGLGLLNPYIVLISHRANIADPEVYLGYLGNSCEDSSYLSLKTQHDEETERLLANPATAKRARFRENFRTLEDYKSARYYENRSYLTDIWQNFTTISTPSPPMKVTCFAGEVDFNKNYQDFVERGSKMFEGRFGTLSNYYEYVVYRYLPMLRKEFGSVAFLDTSLIPYGLITSLNRGGDS